jgi:hypothetical protein
MRIYTSSLFSTAHRKEVANTKYLLLKNTMGKLLKRYLFLKK